MGGNGERPLAGSCTAGDTPPIWHGSGPLRAAGPHGLSSTSNRACWPEADGERHLGDRPTRRGDPGWPGLRTSSVTGAPSPLTAVADVVRGDLTAALAYVTPAGGAVVPAA